MIDKEEILKHIEQRVDVLNTDYQSYKKNNDSAGLIYVATVKSELEKLKTFIDSLPEEPVSKDLEEEINKFVDIPENQGNPDLKEELSKCAHHFAQWQEQQDEKDTSDVLTVVYLRGADEGKKIMVDKACEWLEENLINYWGQLFANYYGQINANDTEQFIKNFRKAMEE